MHGVFDGCKTIQPLLDHLVEVHPGTNVTNICMYNYVESAFDIKQMVTGVAKVVEKYSRDHPEGFNMIGFSQGGLVLRAVVEKLNITNVHTFIALSSPLMGEFGNTYYLQWLFPNTSTELVYHLLYTSAFQSTLSIAGYWRDPFQHEEYLKYCEFLPELNNEVEKPFSADQKVNFQRPQRMVCVGGPDDGVIMPWESAIYQFYAPESFAMLGFEETKEYKMDLFGLQSMDKAGKLVRISVPGVQHHDWYKKKNILEKYIAPYLE